MRPRLAVAGKALCFAFALAPAAQAQQAPPPAQPSAYPPQQYPPQQYPPQQYPPQQYPPQQYPPQQYPPQQYPPQQYPAPRPAPYGYQAPYELPYKEGQPIPVGYHLTEQPRYGLALGGWLTLGIPYGISIIAASAGNFENESTWLLLPVFGPWMTLGRRDYGDCDDSSSDEGLTCVADVFVVMGLIMDGIAQAGGATMLIIGYTSTKKKLIRDDMGLRISPRAIASGYGLMVSGDF